MRYQAKGFSCGPASIVNALRIFGTKVAESRIRTLCGTTEKNGTDEDGIKLGLTELSFSFAEFETQIPKDGLLWLAGSINIGPVIACFDSWQHWVTIIGKVGNKFIVIDPANTKKNKAENGVTVMGERQLLKRWKHKKDGAVYGILVQKKK